MKNHIESVKKQISQLNPFKVMLFGSYAHGMPDEDSDMDIIVILDNEDMPQNFSERMKNHSKVRKNLRAINKKIAMDILVYTKAEWNKLIETDNSFIREVTETGKVII